MFKKGNIVRFKYGSDSNKKRLQVIECSYGEKYGNGSVYGGYSVLDKETGNSSAWWDDNELEFVSDGGIEEIKKCYEIAQKNKERDENLKYIKKEILDSNTFLSSISILKLFHEIGYKSSFEKSGEFCVLYEEWSYFRPIFDALFNNKYNKMMESVNNIFKEECRDKYIPQIIELFNEINN